jgi:hypothetical protein
MEGVTRARFHTEPMIRAAELLLQEPAPGSCRAVALGEGDIAEDPQARSATYARRSSCPTPLRNCYRMVAIASCLQPRVRVTAVGGFGGNYDGERRRLRRLGIVHLSRDVEAIECGRLVFNPSAPSQTTRGGFSEDRASSRQDGELHTT